MKKDSNYSLANVTSNFLNSTLLCYEPPAPESLTQFRKGLLKKKK